MKLKLLRFVASLVLLSFLAVPPASALVMVAIPASYYVASAAIHAAALVAGALMKWNDGPAKISPSGSATKKADVVWIQDADIPGGTPTVVEKQVQTKMPASKIKELANKANADGSDKYPVIKSMLKGPGKYPNPTKIMPSGTNFKGADGDYRSSGTPTGHAVCNGTCPSYIGVGTVQSGKYIFMDGVDSNGNNLVWKVSVTTAPPPPIVDLTPEEIAQKLTAAVEEMLTDADVVGPARTELDKMFADPDYVPHFTNDDLTSYVFPTSDQVMTPAEVDQYNKVATYKAAQSESVTSASSAASTASSAASTAASNASTAASTASTAAAASAANPADAGLKLAADNAAAAATAASNAATAAAAVAAKAAADLAALQAAVAKAASDEANEEDPVDTSDYTAPVSDGTAYGDGAVFDFGARTGELFSALSGSALFSLPSEMLGSIPSGGTSTYTFNGGRYGSHTFDFSSYASVFVFVKSLVLILFSWCAVKIVTLKGGSS